MTFNIVYFVFKYINHWALWNCWINKSCERELERH